ncbi:MAG TPA: hypothetical protein VHE80_09380 [Acidimicrobiales bacterium]|nr:hypothetical protein [Acidimicrobiales bacterium]
MSQFTAPLLVTPLNDGKSWVIVSDDFKYDVGSEGSGDSVDVKRTLMYLAVRWFGGWAWSTNARRNRKHRAWKITDPADLGLPAATTAEAGPLAYDRANAPAVEDVREVVEAKRQA